MELFYHDTLPAHLREASELSEMQRLRGVGMNCGCEYTDFPLFRTAAPYSRFDHSLGAALIVWHFTEDRTQSLAALFHDVATPAFAHVIDFLCGDALRQEATEAGTEDILRRSGACARLLSEWGIPLDSVCDYHRYPIADNDLPRLSADRLEYTLGNWVRFGFGTEAQARALYADLTVAAAEDGAPELAFRHADEGECFARAALRCSRVYVSDADRCAMQYLAELLRDALQDGVLRRDDLMRTEREVIALLTADETYRARWLRFRALHATAPQPPHYAFVRSIPAKKRWIDPLVVGRGRVSALSPAFRAEAERFLALDLSVPVSAE